jgi:hypothetical protein
MSTLRSGHPAIASEVTPANLHGSTAHGGLCRDAAVGCAASRVLSQRGRASVARCVQAPPALPVRRIARRTPHTLRQASGTHPALPAFGGPTIWPTARTIAPYARSAPAPCDAASTRPQPCVPRPKVSTGADQCSKAPRAFCSVRLSTCPCEPGDFFEGKKRPAPAWWHATARWPAGHRGRLREDRL